MLVLLLLLLLLLLPLLLLLLLLLPSLCAALACAAAAAAVASTFAAHSFQRFSWYMSVPSHTHSSRSASQCNRLRLGSGCARASSLSMDPAPVLSLTANLVV
jgi:hypothetical protein